VHHLETGAVVRVRGERWLVVRLLTHESCVVAELSGTGDGNRGTTARFILPCEEVERVSTPSTLARPVRPVVFRAVARRVLSAAVPAWSSLRAAATARIALLPYQLEPAIAMTRGLSCRFLLADAVGLGKTIQAGLLIAELLARDGDSRILIVAPAGLREQWRDELRDRFDIDTRVIDAAALARATAVLPVGVNPWALPGVVLTSIDFVKRPEVIRALEPLVWDLIAFDEAHGLGGRSDRGTAAELLARRGRRVVAITATPHSGDSDTYARLRALGHLGPDDPLLVFRRSRDDAGIASRRVTRLLRVRPTLEEAAVHHALEGYARRVSREAPSESAQGARLAMMVLARRAASSAASLARSVQRRMALLDTNEAGNTLQLALPLGDGVLRDDEEPDAELATPGMTDITAEMRWLRRIYALARLATIHESKIGALERLLRRSDEPAIVFTEYRDTLEHVMRILAGRPQLPCAAVREEPPHGGLATLHGGMTTAQRACEARRFTHGEARVLLATDAASEGLNLHHRCRLVINLEMPWTPLRLEQRIGRADRIGQERRVHAVGLVARGTAEESVVASLSARAATAEREAPFAGANLRVDAEAEVERLATSRALTGNARIHVRNDERRSARASERPLVCVLRNNRSRVYAAVRLSFVDKAGFELWDTVIGIQAFLAGPIPVGAITAISSVTRAATAESHDCICRRLRDELRVSIKPLIVREQAMLHALETRRGRLAAPLVQPGLFDRRALREGAAQQRIAKEAAAAAAERIRTLARLSNPRAGTRRFVFVAVA
jgi:ERCC4-related helicase